MYYDIRSKILNERSGNDDLLMMFLVRVALQKSFRLYVTCGGDDDVLCIPKIA